MTRTRTLCMHPSHPKMSIKDLDALEAREEVARAKGARAKITDAPAGKKGPQ